MNLDPFLLSKSDTKREIRDLLNQTNGSICFIFGAGASYGYSKDNRYSPPTVENLFNEENLIVKEVIARHPSIKSRQSHIIKEIKNHQNDLEIYLSKRYSGKPEDKLFGDLLSYLEDVFISASNKFVSEPNSYKDLINLMWELHGSKSWSFLSFNYDTLLEKSYLEADNDPKRDSFGSLKDYLNFSPSIIKVHGGINFRHQYIKPCLWNDPESLSNYFLFSEMMSDRNKNGFKIVPPNLTEYPSHRVEHKIDSDGKLTNEEISIYDFPLMLIPIHATIRPENPFFEKMINRAKEEIEKSSMVVAIGYNFGDDAFMEELKKIDFSKKELMLVNTNQFIQNILKETKKEVGFERMMNFFKGDYDRFKIFNGDGFGEFVESLY